MFPFPISPLTPPSPWDAPHPGGHSHRPARRMDVERHRQEDLRARYVPINWTNVTIREERESRLAAPLRSLRVSVATMLIAAGEYLRRQPAAEPIDTA